MLVSRSNFAEVVGSLVSSLKLAADTETTGLRPYHGDRLFSIILANASQASYFNFWAYPEMSPETILEPWHLQILKDRVFEAEPTRLWFMHKAPFDLSMLRNVGIHPAGTIHCTQAQGRVVYNEHMSYSLEESAARIGEKKDDAVERYIEEHHLWEWQQIPGKNKRVKNKFFYKVPPDIIVPYGCTDAQVTYRLGISQEEAVQRIVDETPKTLPDLFNIVRSERALTSVVSEMERVGLRVDRPYCLRAAQYEADRAAGFMAEFERLTGDPFKASPKLYESVFASERENWEFTEKKNPSFESDVLKKFSHPAAPLVLGYRDAKSKHDFYQGFLWHMDPYDIVHPNLNQGGAATGRFTSSEPNFQNLTSEDSKAELNQEFVVRRAIIPRPGYLLIMPDYDQVEYRMMLDYAAMMVGYETPLIQQVKGGLDVHEASRQLILQHGIDLPRSIVKNGNFAVLYGSGLDTLAATIKGTKEAARSLREAIFKAAPEMQVFIRRVMQTAEARGHIFNWAGRRFECPDARFAYKFPNRLIQGGAADVMKFAMVQVANYLCGLKSRMILTIHDELVLEVHESEISEVPRRVKAIMEQVYPHKYLPLTVGVEWSAKSLADKIKGFPGEKAA